jgi:hypothetical protein
MVEPIRGPSRTKATKPTPKPSSPSVVGLLAGVRPQLLRPTTRARGQREEEMHDAGVGILHVYAAPRGAWGIFLTTTLWVGEDEIEGQEPRLDVVEFVLSAIAEIGTFRRGYGFGKCRLTGGPLQGGRPAAEC